SSLSFLFLCYPYHLLLHSFPTRRSSDLEGTAQAVPSLHVLPSSPISPRRTAPRPPSVPAAHPTKGCLCERTQRPLRLDDPRSARSEEHTSELQSRENLVCRLLLEKKKTT